MSTGKETALPGGSSSVGTKVVTASSLPALGSGATNFAFGKDLRLALFQRIQHIEKTRSRESHRGPRFTSRPDVDQPVESVFLILKTKVVAWRSRFDVLATPKPSPLVADDRLDRR